MLLNKSEWLDKLLITFQIVKFMEHGKIVQMKMNLLHRIECVHLLNNNFNFRFFLPQTPSKCLTE